MREKTLNQAVNLQDIFLNQVRKEKISVVLYLTNGFQMKGYVKGFDNYIVILEADGKQQLIFKHAISTVMPSRDIHLSLVEDEE